MTEATERVRLLGSLRDSGIFEFTRADPAPGALRGQFPRSPFQFEVLGESGDVIERVQAAARPRPACNPTRVEITGTVTFSERSHTVRLLEGGRELWRDQVGVAPSVRATIEGRPSRDNGATVTVHSDAEETPTYMRVTLRPDGAEDGDSDLVVLPTTTLAPSARVDLESAPGGTWRLVVTVGSGVRWSSAVTGAFRLPLLGKYLAINSPADGAQLAPGQSARLSAGVIDLDSPDQPVAEHNEVEWLVDGESVAVGLAAATPPLTIGDHTVTVRVRGARRLSLSVTVRVCA